MPDTDVELNENQNIIKFIEPPEKKKNKNRCCAKQ